MRSVDEVWVDMLNDVLAFGSAHSSRAGSCVEVIGRQFKLYDLERTFLTNGRRNLSLQYAAAELLWYLSETGNTKMICAYAPQYEKFTEADGTAYGAYGARMKEQLPMIIDLLRSNPNTRQAVISMWNETDLEHAIEGDRADIPCTTTWQFIIRSNQLHMVCSIRSNDIWLGLPYDVYVNTIMLRLIAQAVGVRPGSYTHQVGSLHLYDTNRRASEESVECKTYTSNCGHYAWNEQSYFDSPFNEAPKVCAMEKEIRMGQLVMNNAYYKQVRNLILRDHLLLCASKWTKINPELITSKLLKEVFIANH